MPEALETGPGGVARMFVLVGLPAAGKPSRARELASEWSALLLTPDEWMIPLFGQEQPEGKRNVLEGRLIWLALAALRPDDRGRPRTVAANLSAAGYDRARDSRHRSPTGGLRLLGDVGGSVVANFGPSIR